MSKIPSTVEEWLGAENTLGVDMWLRKYRYTKTNDDGSVYEESFPEWVERISAGDEDLKDMIISKKFLFGGRILANRGLEKFGKKISFSNCYVMRRPDDCIESIFDTARDLARTYSYGGGCGVDISNLSPKGAKINNASKETSGSVSFMDLYSMVTELIGQNGRRGALMISMSCEHPDIEDFITIKTDLNRVTKANISVRITKKFMEAVENDSDFTLHFKRDATGEVIEKTVKARDLFRLMAETNWGYAEPGMLYWDRIENYNLLSNNKKFRFDGVNPCAEEPLPAGGSCLLGSINLAEFVIEPFKDFKAKYGKNPGIADIISNIDIVGLSDTVHHAVIALNDVLEEGLPLHPLKFQQESVGKWRQIGLGIMGLADLLVKLKVPYGSEKAVLICRYLGAQIARQAIRTSAILADERGAYDECNPKDIVKTEYFKAVYETVQHQNKNDPNDLKNLVLRNGLRNSQLLTIAPTGSISNMLGVSGGVEPIFALSYQRKTESLYGEDHYYTIYTKIAKEYMEYAGIENLDDCPDFLNTARDIKYMDRIAMQAAWQDFIDASISSTVNLPEETTVEEVENLYLEAYKAGLKGITVYRDNCMRTAILTDTKSAKKDSEEPEETDDEDSRVVDPELYPEDRFWGYVLPSGDNEIGMKRKIVTGCGNMHCIAFFDKDTYDLREVYLNKGSSGGCNNFMIGFSRLLSTAARAGVPLANLIDQLESTGVCPSYAKRTAMKGDTSTGSCCPMAVGRALKEMYAELTGNINIEPDEKPVKKPGKISEDDFNFLKSNPVCPECGEPLVFEGGCSSCKSCGWTKCT